MKVGRGQRRQQPSQSRRDTIRVRRWPGLRRSVKHHPVDAYNFAALARPPKHSPTFMGGGERGDHDRWGEERTPTSRPPIVGVRSSPQPTGLEPESPIKGFSRRHGRKRRNPLTKTQRHKDREAFHGFFSLFSSSCLCVFVRASSFSVRARRLEPVGCGEYSNRITQRATCDAVRA